MRGSGEHATVPNAVVLGRKRRQWARVKVPWFTYSWWAPAGAGETSQVPSGPWAAPLATVGLLPLMESFI